MLFADHAIELLDQGLENLQTALVTILVQDMRMKIFWLSIEEAATAAWSRYWQGLSDWKFFFFNKLGKWRECDRSRFWPEEANKCRLNLRPYLLWYSPQMRVVVHHPNANDQDRRSCTRWLIDLRTRGSGNSLRPFRPSSRPGTLSFSNRAPLLWNNLPPSIQQAPSTPSFKSNYLKYLLCSPNSAQHLELALGNPLC